MRVSQSGCMEVGQVWPAEWFGPGDVVLIDGGFSDTVQRVTIERQVPGLRQWFCVTGTGRGFVISWDEPAELVIGRGKR